MAKRAVKVAVAILGVVAAGSAATVPAAAGTPALVVEAESGKVLFADRATDPWFPASITKLMTTYVALDQVRQGKVTLSTPLTLSAGAAAQPPSKMGLAPGTQVTLDNALKIIMVKSANDMATMIGENLGGGSVEGFAALMNATSARLGMHESRWTNPSGLPDERQQTSARDMAILARALLTEFPEHEPLFRIGALKLGPQVMRNHNGLLGRYPGADGMKTGFICMGGFNVVASATQNGRRLIAVVMGYPSARERDLRAADLFDDGFRSSAGWGAQRVEALPPSGSLSAPNMRGVVCGPHKRQPEDDDEPALVARTPASDNPLAALFQPTGFGNPASAAGAPILGSRRTLGPRVAFEPIPIFIGATQDAAPTRTGSPVRLAAKPVKTKALSRSAGAPLPATASAFSPTLRPTAEARIIETVKVAPRRPAAEAVAQNLGSTPAAEAKPKLGAVGGGSAGRRPNLGGIEPAKRDAVAAPASDAATTSRREAAAPAAKPSPRPVVPARTAATAPQTTAAAAPPKPAAKPAGPAKAKPKPAEPAGE